jgi:Tfp pilus assembly protein FimT
MRLKNIRRRQDGFSMMELVVVAAIIIIASAVALPNIIRYIQMYRVRAASEEVMAEIQRARAQAIMQNVNCGVVFVTESASTYRTVIEDGQFNSQDVANGAAAVNKGICLTPANAIAQDDQTGGGIRRLPEGIQFSAAECGIAPDVQSIRFNRLGMACKPGGGAANCAAFAGGVPATIAFGGAGVPAGAASICLADVRRPAGEARFARRVTVTPGGRVSSQQQ